MADSKDHQELKYVCKLCKKRYPSGKSLGGHMRSHVIANSRSAVRKVKSAAQKASIFHGGGSEGKKEGEFRVDNGGGGAGNSGYGLREKPKKTWRPVDSSFTLKQGSDCKLCVRRFQSQKALCDHLSSHSAKQRRFMKYNVDDDDDDDADNVVHGETNRRKRLRGVRYKNLAIDSFSLPNCSSSNSEIEHEQEEIAISLMMLSRDSGLRSGGSGGVNFKAESSDKNSVIVKGGSSSKHVGTAKRKHLNSGSNANQTMKIMQAESKNFKCAETESSDSGYFEDGAKELESDDSVDGFIRNLGFKKPKVDYGSKFETSDPKLGNSEGDRKSNGNCSSEKALVMADECYTVHRAQMEHNFSSSTRRRGDFNTHIVNEFFTKKIKQDFVSHEAQKNGRCDSNHKCSVCNKNFKNRPSLCRHTVMHKNMTLRNAEKRVIFPRKTKEHKCPYCLKVFRSGQALGGHKRSHVICGSSTSDAAEPSSLVEKKPQLLDLNFPAPMEEEVSRSG
ncbi:hypothetical protein Nepgr_033025 [Nepenthes gracilis]|uniref:C2H2-type domain-containing protein n=1 Tax=Nepenthes gracilis TaxID=150966 RepID=A0AAD3Y696_NEPGR|nr:hypothetical protein Nepgr_033025 [Nepenthes gracilis]